VLFHKRISPKNIDVKRLPGRLFSKLYAARKSCHSPIECQRFSVVGFLTVIFIITYFYKNDKLFSKSLQNLLRTDKKSSFSAKPIRYSCKTRSAKEGKRRGAFPLAGPSV